MPKPEPTDTSEKFLLDRPLVVCPLEFERQTIAKRMRKWPTREIDLACCGPGPEAITQWANASDRAKGARVWLAGVAGGLSDRVGVGRAVIVSEVVTDKGDRRAMWRTSEGVRVVSVAAPASTVADKHALRASSGADLVDCESEAFVAAAEQRGWRWAIIRGVSDGMNEELPYEMLQWIDARGRTRFVAAGLALAGRPKMIPAVMRIARQSQSALRKRCRPHRIA